MLDCRFSDDIELSEYSLDIETLGYWKEVTSLKKIWVFNPRGNWQLSISIKNHDWSQEEIEKYLDWKDDFYIGPDDNEEDFVRKHEVSFAKTYLNPNLIYVNNQLFFDEDWNLDMLLINWRELTAIKRNWKSWWRVSKHLPWVWQYLEVPYKVFDVDNIEDIEEVRKI